MTENKERVPNIIVDSLRWFRGRWNEAYYGFPEGKSSRDRMETLLSQPVVGRKGLNEMLNLMVETYDSLLQVRMAEKIGAGVKQLVAREEGLE